MTEPENFQVIADDGAYLVVYNAHETKLYDRDSGKCLNTHRNRKPLGLLSLIAELHEDGDVQIRVAVGPWRR